MFDSTAPDHPDPAPAAPGRDPGVDPAPRLDPGVEYQLPANAYYHLIRTLRLTLPPPPTDTREDLLRRDDAAIARIAGLAPGNTAEADVAAQYVAAAEQWKDCLRLVRLAETTPEWAQKYRTQAATMMREANSAMRLLLQMQAARRKLEADNTARDRVAWTEHVATRLMTEALSHLPHPDPLPGGEGEGATSPLPPGEGQPRRRPGEGQVPSAAIPEAAEPAEPPLTGWRLSRRLAETDPEMIAAAERYAAAYPERAAQIRRTGKMLNDVCYFDPPESALAAALIAARTPALLALDAVPEACPVPRYGAGAA